MLQKPFFFVYFIFQGISLDNEKNLAWELDKDLLSILSFYPIFLKMITISHALT